MGKSLPNDAAWSKQFPSPVVASGQSRWHAPESAHQLRRPDCSSDIKLDISIRSFSRKPRKSSDKIDKESKVKQELQNGNKERCPSQSFKTLPWRFGNTPAKYCLPYYVRDCELNAMNIINYNGSMYVVHLKKKWMKKYLYKLLFTSFQVTLRS